MLIKNIYEIKFSDPQIRYLIDYANLKHGIIKYQNDFLNPIQFDNFVKNIHYGFPLLLPLGIKYFDYEKKCVFKLNKKSSFKRKFLEVIKNI